MITTLPSFDGKTWLGTLRWLAVPIALRLTPSTQNSE
jgi:hypothetical protein